MDIKEFYNLHESKINTARKKCIVVSRGNLTIQHTFDTNYIIFSVQNKTGSVGVVCVWDDDSMSDKLEELNTKIAQSIECGYGIPKGTTKPMFSVEELYISIASENI